MALKTIGEVQGTTLDTENGATDRSPFAGSGGNIGTTVVVRPRRRGATDALAP